MDKFTTLTGIAAPLPMTNVDTDMIIPKQYLKTIKRTGLGKHLFDEMRFTPANKRAVRHGFQFGDRSIQILLDLLGVFISIDPEVAKVAAFAAKRDMMVKAEFSVRIRLRIERHFHFYFLVLGPK